MGSNKVQGEGDYESARRYRKAAEQSAKEQQARSGKAGKGEAGKVSAKLTPEEREGRSRARTPGQDKRDAAYMDELEKKKR